MGESLAIAHTLRYDFKDYSNPILFVKIARLTSPTS
jgi:hypothetical protein